MSRVVSVALLLLPGLAAAGGFEAEYPDNNALVLGRGGAFVARADDPSAIQYNPAGLGKLEGFNLLLSVNLVNVIQDFQPAPDRVLGGRSTRTFESVEQEVPLIAAPALALHFDFEALPDLDFAVGVYGPSGTSHRRFPNQWTIASIRNASGDDVSDRARGDQANSLAGNAIFSEAKMIQAYPTLAVAWAITEDLRVGVSLQASMLDAEIKKAIGGPAPAVVTLDVQDWFTPTGILGVQYAPVSWLELGVMYRPGFVNEATGTVELTRFTDCPSGPCPADASGEPLGPYGLDGEIPVYGADGSLDDGLEFRFSNPDIVRVGARFVQPRFDVELDYVWMRNSVHEAFEIRFQGTRAELPLGEGSQPVEPVPDIDDERFYVDTHSLRLGGDVVVIPGLLTLRAGATYETGASPDAYTNLDFPGLDLWSAHLGASLHFELVDIDVGFAHVGLIEREVTESELGVIDITVEPEKWRPAGNGTFGGAYNVLGLGTTWHL